MECLNNKAIKHGITDTLDLKTTFYGSERIVHMNGERIETDILVIGGGLAGSFAAIKAREAGIDKVTLVSKGKLGKDSISSFAAGVYRALFPEDNREEWFQNIALSEGLGAGLYNEDWLNVWLDESYDVLSDMDKWGVIWE